MQDTDIQLKNKALTPWKNVHPPEPEKGMKLNHTVKGRSQLLDLKHWYTLLQREEQCCILPPTWCLISQRKSWRSLLSISEICSHHTGALDVVKQQSEVLKLECWGIFEWTSANSMTTTWAVQQIVAVKQMVKRCVDCSISQLHWQITFFLGTQAPLRFLQPTWLLTDHFMGCYHHVFVPYTVQYSTILRPVDPTVQTVGSQEGSK